MKYVLLALFSILAFKGSYAASGDTTWVQANEVQMDYYNDFDTTINFPDGSVQYRKIIMIFTLGKYVCPGAPTYCSDWDYTVQTYAMNKLGDTVELGRLITPYAKGARMPASWAQEYYFDVTDYSTVLKDSNKIRIHYSGYSGGFTANIRFAMIEGTPDRNVLGVNALWDGSFQYGDPANPIDTKLPTAALTPPTGAASAVYRLNITGHGADLNGCSEFCQKYYHVLKDGALVKEQQIWRDNCGSNQLYPQSGTWIYDRGNWCPGDLVHTLFHPIPSITAGTKFDLGMTFEPYTRSLASSSPSYPVYTVFGSVVYYGPMNKTLDASLEEIIAPNNYGGNFRENNRIGFTTVKIHNSGSAVINNIEFEYGVSGQPLSKATWSGTLASLADTIIDLPIANSLLKASGTNLAYEVRILKVNATVDEDATNNGLMTTFDAAPEWPNIFTIIFRTNNALVSGVSETEWKVEDISTGSIVAQRINNAATTSYYDTLDLPTGIYALTVSDQGCDGLSFWANPSVGSGSMQVKPTAFTSLTLKGYFSGDFGCGFKQYFRVGSPTSIKSVHSEITTTGMVIYPNPANNEIFIDIEGLVVSNGTLTITDNMGKVISIQKVRANNIKMSVSTLANGLYFANYTADDANAPKIVAKFIVLK